MTKREKLIARFVSFPADFTWDELKRLLAGFGYGPAGKGKTSGSRVRFTREDYPPIILHKPHPGSIVRRYQLRQIHEFLMSEGLLGDDDESNEI
jgi:hypothetical protein